MGGGKVGGWDASDIGLPCTLEGAMVSEVGGRAATEESGPDKKVASVFCVTKGWLSAEWYVPLLPGLVWASRPLALSWSSKSFPENSVMSRSTSRSSTTTPSC